MLQCSRTKGQSAAEVALCIPTTRRPCLSYAEQSRISRACCSTIGRVAVFIDKAAFHVRQPINSAKPRCFVLTTIFPREDAAAVAHLAISIAGALPSLQGRSSASGEQEQAAGSLSRCQYAVPAGAGCVARRWPPGRGWCGDDSRHC